MKKLLALILIAGTSFAYAGNQKEISISIQPNVNCFSGSCDVRKHIRVNMRGANPVQVTKIKLNNKCEIEENPYGYMGVWSNFSMGKSIPIPEYTSCGQTVKVEVFTSGGHYSFMLPN